MPRKTSHNLTPTHLKNAKPKDRQYKLFDGNGLFILVHPNGSKYFRLRYRIHSKEKVMALGVFPEVTLAEARLKAEEARKLVKEGLDPVATRQQAHQERQQEVQAEQAKQAHSFEKVAREWWLKEQDRCTSKHAREAIRSLENHAFPQIGHFPIQDVTIKQVKALLLELQDSGRIETAHRIHQRIRSVFQYAVIHEISDRNPAADLHGILKPKQAKPMRSMPLKELPDYLRKIDETDSLHYVTRVALKLIIMLFVRTTELIEAKWEEFDLQNALWRIPEERMKMRVEHLVPLPRQALELLTALHQVTGSYEYVFPGDRKPTQPMSNNTLLYGGIYRMGYRSRATIHGFRAVASTILNESGKWNKDAIERQMAHSEGNKVRAAYNRADYLKERKDMMQWFADHLDQLRDQDNLIDLSEARNRKRTA
jgi:integrase